ncbi:MAG TPA: molybdate ABC transporter substrate-binding protein [Burkholderiales bacterium]|nr:molybdate ABC transporter substrate-binding protein [Burkholderiales bacterium]
MGLLKRTAATFACSLLLSLPARAQELFVSAAASLTDAFTDIGRAYEKSRPGTRVLLNFGGSGQLLQQIAKGAPVDVFASADEETMDKGERAGWIVADSRDDFARNALVLVLPRDSRLTVRSLRDLTHGEFRRIAIGNPDSVPAGRYGKAVLAAAGLWEALQARLITTQNVRQSLDYVARGEVDAAFVYRTDAALMPDRIRIGLEVASQVPVRYPIAVVEGSRNPKVARDFIAFVRSAAGQAILKKYGFAGP